MPYSICVGGCPATLWYALRSCLVNIDEDSAVMDDFSASSTFAVIMTSCSVHSVRRSDLIVMVDTT